MKRLFKCLALMLTALFVINVMYPFTVQADTADASEWKNINGRKYLYNEDGSCVSTTGVDVSKWQGDIDWKKVAGDDIQFAIIRVGHGHGDNWADTYADANMKGCEENGIPYGVYYYSEATTKEEATLEANNLLERLKGKNPQIGVFIDVEATDVYEKAGIDPYKNGEKIVELADIMLNMVSSAGYIPGIYANTDYYDNVLYPASHFYSAIRWVARYYHYNESHDDNNPIPEGNWDIWQYGSTGSVAGINGNVDLDAKLTEPYNRDYNAITNAPNILYHVHVQNDGDQAEVKNGGIAGTTGESKRLEGIWINLSNSPYDGSVSYRTHIQNIGWEDGWKTNGQLSGTTGQSLRLEAIQIKLTGEISNHYDIYYRVHAQNYGWLGWASNGESTGTEGCSYRLEAIQIQLVPKGGTAPGSMENAFRHPKVSYTTHVQKYGWQNNAFDGMESGTTGKGLQLEGIRISLPEQKYSGSVQYRTHIQNIGWETDWKENGQLSGAADQALRLEAIQIQLTGEMAEHYDIYYRVHAQNFGWLGWAKNGDLAGTEGYAYRLEAIQIQLVDKGGAAPGNTENTFRHSNVSYGVKVQNVGWQKNAFDGMEAGTTGKSLQLEGIHITLPEQKYSGSVQYHSHIQNIGWENGWKENGQISGTEGQSLRLEAIQIQLTGEMAEHYDIYYRVHAQNFGWLGWAKNGASAGTAGYSYRLEAIQIQLVTKGGTAPGSVDNAFYEAK